MKWNSTSPLAPPLGATRGARLVVAVLMVSVLACSKRASPSSEDGAGEPVGEVVVFAAASLTDAFTALGEELERTHPGITVNINFAGSQSLRTQIENGATPHVFASANAKHIEALSTALTVGSAVEFARNRMVVAVPASNPAGLEAFGDLPKAERIVLAGEAVPAGAYAAEVLRKAAARYGDDFEARVSSHVVSRETHVRQTLQKVALGEADAALVYATDAASAGDQVATIPIPDELNVQAAYPIVAIAGAPRPDLSELFIEFAVSEPGARVLREHGFDSPGAALAGGE